MIIPNFEENETKRIEGIESISVSFGKVITSKITTIIPTSGSRIKHITKTIQHLQESRKNNDVEIVVIQYSSTPSIEKDIKKLGIHYVFAETKNPFNKSLAMNICSLYVQSKYLHFHDCDILVKEDFYDKLFEKIELNTDPILGIQPFKERRVLYINQPNTDCLFDDSKTLGDISNDTGSYTAGRPGAPGGSILVSSIVFHLVGGFDFCLFEGYGAEDELFWRKISMLVQIKLLDDVDVYHMFHAPNSDVKPQSDVILGEYEKLAGQKGHYLQKCRESIKKLKKKLNGLIINADIRYIA